MNYLDRTAVEQISSRMRNFKRKSGNLYQMSCPFCGDSSKDTRKARGYIYQSNGKTVYHCHNCGITYHLTNFLKNVDYAAYEQYYMEKYRSEKTEQQLDLERFVAKMKPPVFAVEDPLRNLKKVSALRPDDSIKQFVVARKIPNHYHYKLFKCPRFFEWVNDKCIPGKFDQTALMYDECRLVIPFIDRANKCHAVQGRSLDQTSKSRYITIVIDDSKPKVWGLDAVAFDKPIYVLEGPIDAMFIDNSIATAGGDLISTIAHLPTSKYVIVYDNERHSKETKAKLHKAIVGGYDVCIWPDRIDQKDVNQMVIDGLTVDYVKDIIDTNTYSGLAARMALTQWSKA